eukprot:2600046-Ditylum_brightwellii.AAC.1
MEEEEKKDEDEVKMPDLPEALRLAVKVLNKTMDGTAASLDKMELFSMTLDEDGSCVHRILGTEE